MPWFRVDDTLHSHPKTRRAGLPALGLWTVAGSYSCQYITEGFVPDWFVSAQKSGQKVAQTLVSSGLWERTERDGESGYQFHDWEHFQMTKEEVLADREHNRERQRRFREKKRDARNAVTNGVSNGGSNGTPTLPNPTYVVGSTEVERSGNVSSEPENDHRLQDEPRSQPVPISVNKVARIYTAKVKPSDHGKVCGVIVNATGQWAMEQIQTATERLASDSRQFTAETLRIELYGTGPDVNGITHYRDGSTRDANGVERNRGGQVVGGGGPGTGSPRWYGA